MENITEISIGKLTAIWSFALGTLLFLSYLITGASVLLPIGFYYLIFIVPVNILVLLTVILAAFIKREKPIEYVKTISFILLNIPIAFIYLRLLNF
ncbi:hypothetical protein [Pedobacter xixiisoli]|uniref:Branched-chain amino acid:cation transporter, LIVCS family n=1 Tax=Pedobacter xixiisoli TaxID=1476464 RepID=A0A285ZPT1_9SPHI|nr:hypothetical protein [Pedobacter xixiisoli]SOD11652.1 hypothetical protein SAMN06297358_0264 [Pedobacter xixiisoli]